MMKRISIALAAVALLLASCQPKQEQFKLTASGLPDSINGTYAVVLDIDNQPIDSIAINGGGFTYTVPANDSLIGTIAFGNHTFPFAYEAGEYTITKSGENYVCGGEEGSQFVAYQSFVDELKAVQDKYQPQLEALQPASPEVQSSEEDIKKMYEIYDQYQAAQKEVCLKYFNMGGNSIVEYSTFLILTNVLTPQEFIDCYNKAGSIIKDHPQIKTILPKMEAAAKTDVGGQFIDYQIVNPAGESKQLSEFRAEGKYFLLDFFASWCGPCKRSMPVIAEIEKQYADILTSVSVAVWEQDADGADYANAVKELKITWPTMQDGQSEGANLYGVTGVPTFILFSPEGEIILRGHDIEAVKAKLQELSTK